MSTVQKITIILISITIPLVAVIYSDNYFLLTFQRRNIYQNFSYSHTELTKQFHSILQYLHFGDNSKLDPQFFSREDILHMRDVKNLYGLVYLILIISVIILLVTLIKKVKPAQNHLWIIGFLLIALYLFANFDAAFIEFHKIFFPYNTYWSLDPATSNLIKFLPEYIFAEIAFIWLGSFIVIYLLLSKLVQMFRPPYANGTVAG